MGYEWVRLLWHGLVRPEFVGSYLGFLSQFINPE